MRTIIECAKCHRSRPLQADGMCHNCYESKRRRGEMAKTTQTRVICLGCGRRFQAVSKFNRLCWECDAKRDSLPSREIATRHRR